MGHDYQTQTTFSVVPDVAESAVAATRSRVEYYTMEKQDALIKVQSEAEVFALFRSPGEPDWQVG